MRYIYLIYCLIFINGAMGQNVVKVINITPGENAVTVSLPFDRPIVLKWISKEVIIIKYAGLITIKKGEASQYYKLMGQRNDFYAYQPDTYGDGHVKLIDQTLTTTSTINADGKNELNIIIPPLEPNKFYDVKILRRPLDSELSLYVDLFSSNADNVAFEKKLRYINKIKQPFAHRYIAGSKAGELTSNDLHTFYETFLKTHYAELTAAGTDKDKVAAAIAKIKNVIENDSPPVFAAQSSAYLELLKSIKASDEAEITRRIHNIALLQRGYVANAMDDQHIGNFDVAALKKLYADSTYFGDLLNTLAAESDPDKKEALQNEIFNKIRFSGLPVVNDIFIFGQTLSATSKVLDFDTRTGFTITPDFGFVYYGFQKEFNNLTTYVGFQLEFRYFDKNIPFNLIHPKSPLHYLSFTAGLTLTSLKKDGKRDDFFSGKSLLVGLGIRLTSATRITFGGIIFNKLDVNPLLDHKKMTVTPFAGLSIDLKLKSLLNDFYQLSPTKLP